MRYLLGAEDFITQINRKAALDRNIHPDAFTKYWYEVRKTADGLSCLMIDDDEDIPGSTPEEPDWGDVS